MTRPFYARALRLRHIRPGWLLCSIFFEGTIVVAALGALAELVTWWSILVLPLTVALLVKLDDLAAGYRHHGAGHPPRAARHRAAEPSQPASAKPRWARTLRTALAALAASVVRNAPVSRGAGRPAGSTGRHTGGGLVGAAGLVSAIGIASVAGETPGQGASRETDRVRGTAPAPSGYPPRPAGWARGRAQVPGRRLIPPPRTTT